MPDPIKFAPPEPDPRQMVMDPVPAEKGARNPRIEAPVVNVQPKTVQELETSRQTDSKTQQKDTQPHKTREGSNPTVSAVAAMKPAAASAIKNAMKQKDTDKITKPPMPGSTTKGIDPNSSGSKGRS